MNYAEAMKELARLRSLIVAGGDDAVYSQEDRSLIEQLSVTELGKRVRQCNCRDRYTEAVLELYSTMKKRGTMNADRQYLLRAGVLIWIGTQVYTSNNITDEVAEAYLEMHPEDRGKFERVPETYKSPAEEDLVEKAAASKRRRAAKKAAANTEEA